MVKVNSLNDIESGGPKRTPTRSTSSTTSSSSSGSLTDRLTTSGLVLFGKPVQPVHLAMATMVALLFFGVRGLLVVAIVVGAGMCYSPSGSSGSSSFGSRGGGGSGYPSSGGNGGGSSSRIKTIQDLPKPPPSS